MEGATDALSPEGVSALASFVIRPPRAGYSRRELGDKSFIIDDVRATRTDLELVNDRGLRLQCSHFEPNRPGAPPPAVVYLHGNGSCRVEATMLLSHLIPYGISLFAFDFSGSGRSDGEYISLGVREKDDVSTVVSHLLNERRVPKVALWGHSMGAATALMYTGLCKNSPKVAALVLDSPFSSFDKLAEAMVAEMPIPPGVPRKLILSVGARAVRRNVRERANFDVYDIDPLSAVKKIPSPPPPAFFLHGMLDNVVPPSHSTSLYSTYPGKDKQIRYLSGLAHDSPRPDDALESVFEFLMRALSPGGSKSIEYLMQIKARGNFCMITGRYSDASFLYTAALNALATHAVDTDFATACGIIDPASTDQRTSNVNPTRRRWIPLRATTMHFRRNAHHPSKPVATLSDTGLPAAKGEKNGSRKSLDAAARLSTATTGCADTPVTDGPSSATFRHSSAKSASKQLGRAKNFLNSVRRRVTLRGRFDGGSRENKRRARSGRFGKHFPFGDRRDEFRSMGSGTDIRRGDLFGKFNGTAHSSRRTSNEGTISRQPSVELAAECETSDGIPRKSFSRFRRMSRSPSANRLMDEPSSRRSVPRFSSDGWKRRRGARSSTHMFSTRRQHFGSTGVLGMGRETAEMHAGRSASVDLRFLGVDDMDVPSNGVRDIGQWGLDEARKNIALALLGNRSLARRKLGDYNAALFDAVLCLRLEPTWMRGYLRKAVALKEANKLEQAKKTVEDGLAVDPHHAALLDLLVTLNACIAEAVIKEDEETDEDSGKTDANALHNSCSTFATGELPRNTAPIVSPFY